MKAYIRETLHVLDYADNVVDTIFNSDDRITPGYAYNITITEANTGYSDLKFEMPNTILKDNADSIKNPKLALLTPLVKLRYRREVYYTGDQPITVREPSGYGDKVTYVDKTYSNVYPDNKIEDYIMDYIVQPVDKKRDVLKISTTFNAIDYPRFNLSKKRVGLTMVEQTLTHPEWSLYTNKPMDEPGKVKYIQWNSDLSQSAERNDIPLVWDPENAREYPLQKEDIIHLMANSADWPYGLLATCFYWPITSTGRFKGTLYKKGGYLILQIIDFYNLTTEGIDPSLYIDRYSWDWTQMYEIQPYLCPNNALNYLNHILEGTNWSVAMKADGVTPDVDVVQVEVPNPRGSTTSTTTADDTFSMNMSNGNCYNAITNVCKGLQLYPIFDCINRTVALKVFAGKNYGLTYALGNNLKDDSVKLDGEKVISKLYVTGGKDYNGDADINIGTAERSYIQKLNGIYNDAADLPTEDVAGYWAIVDTQIPDSAFEQIRYDKNMNPSTVEVHDTSVTEYWNASDGRQVYFYDNTTNTWSLGTKLDSGNWSGTVNGVEYIVDPVSGSTAPWDPNDDMYIKMRSPYETNYILNVEWYYKNKWMTKEQILELYQYEQQINDLNESFVDGYVDDYRNTRQLYNDAVNNYDIAQDGYESTLLAMENKYYNVDGKYSEGTTYCFHRAPLGTYSAYNPDKQKTTKFIKLFHCYECGLTRGVENGSLIDPTGHEDNYSLGSVCPDCGSDDFVVNEIYVPVYDDFTFEYKESDYPHRPYETHRYNPHLKGYFERLVTTLDRQNRDVEWDVSAYEQRVSMIKGIPMDDQTVTLSDGYTYKLDGVYVRSASGQIEVWDDAIVNYIKNYGDMLTYLRQVNAMLARIQELDDIYDEWKAMVDGINATIQEKFGDYIVEGNYKNEEQPYVELLFREGVEASDKYGVPPVTYNLNVIDSSGLIEYREPRVTKYRCGKCDYLSYHEIDSCPRCGESLILTEVDTYNDLVNILHSIGQIVPKAGDYIKIYDEPMGLFGVPGLITEITRYPDDPIKNQIKIDTGYTDDEELVGNIITATNTVLNNSDIYARTAILKGDGTIDEDSIRETLDDVHANISIVSTNGGILLDGTGLRAIDPTDPHRAMKYAGNGIFNTTNLDNEAGEAVIWEKMMSPSGINATYINSGSIDTNKLTIMSGLSGKVILDQHGLSVKADAGKTNHITAFSSTDAKNDAGYASRWGDTNNLSAFIGVDNQNNPLIYTKGYLYAQEGSNIAGWITDNSGFYHLNGSNQKDLWLSPTGITGTVNDSGSQSFAIYSNGNFGVTTGGALYSKSGKIAGWTINPTELYSNNVHLRSNTGDTTRAIEVSNGKFYVQNNGKLYAQDAEVAGTITATSGTIGGCNITNGVLYIGDTNVSGRISTNHLDSSIITTGNLSAQTINCSQLSGGTINGQTISGGTITSNSGGGTITISNGEITSTSGESTLAIRAGELTVGDAYMTPLGTKAMGSLTVEGDLVLKDGNITVDGVSVQSPFTGKVCFRVQTTSQHALYLGMVNGIIVRASNAPINGYTNISDNYGNPS